MICPLCHGHRLFLVHGQLVPCPECEGHGEIHCCDGLQEQADESEKLRPRKPDFVENQDGRGSDDDHARSDRDWQGNPKGRA